MRTTLCMITGLYCWFVVGESIDLRDIITGVTNVSVLRVAGLAGQVSTPAMSRR